MRRLAWLKGPERARARRTVVVEELFDEVDVSQDHAAAAIALELKLV